MHDSGEDHTHQKTEQRIWQSRNRVDENLGILEKIKVFAHDIHTHEQDTKAGGDLTVIAVVVLFGIGDDHRAHKGKYRNKRLDIDRQQQRGCGRTDFGTEQNTYTLINVHKSGVYKADNHCVGRRGALNNGGYKQAYHHGDEFVAGDFLEHDPELATCGELQALAHVFHTNQEKTKSAQRHYDV